MGGVEWERTNSKLNTSNIPRCRQSDPEGAEGLRGNVCNVNLADTTSRPSTSIQPNTCTNTSRNNRRERDTAVATLGLLLSGGDTGSSTLPCS